MGSLEAAEKSLAVTHAGRGLFRMAEALAMRIGVIAIGKLKSGGERVLVDRYLERLRGAKAVGVTAVQEKELPESRAAKAAERCADEAQRILKAAGDADVLVALDERGRTMTSDAFASWLQQVRDRGSQHIVFAIGGPDGHGDDVIAHATLSLAFGKMTMPHGLARAVLAEQIYRATTILAGHPYHRA
ncbi:MAG: 23S rRNA (pseudouridine(1915)-N(3))-methyltransferase RlmH [Hyphomicrobiaceae bacterium]